MNKKIIISKIEKVKKIENRKITHQKIPPGYTLIFTDKLKEKGKIIEPMA